MRITTRDWSFTNILDGSCSETRAAGIFDAAAARAVSATATGAGATAEDVGPPAEGSACNLVQDRLGVRELWHCIVALEWTRVTADGARERCQSTLRGHLTDADEAVIDAPPVCLAP
jgi:hypothetical protein